MTNSQLVLKALKSNVDVYKFKFYWTGSSQECKVISLPSEITFGSEGALYGHNPNVQGSEIRWQHYEFRFFKVLKKGEERTITFKFWLPDPNLNARRYHLVSYRHVKGCKALKFHLSFDPSVTHQKASLRHLDQNQTERSIEEIGFYKNTQEYITNAIAPKSGMKYSIHWD